MVENLVKAGRLAYDMPNNVGTIVGSFCFDSRFYQARDPNVCIYFDRNKHQKSRFADP